jgi:hypothetical protein
MELLLKKLNELRRCIENPNRDWIAKLSIPFGQVPNVEFGELLIEAWRVLHAREKKEAEDKIAAERASRAADYLLKKEAETEERRLARIAAFSPCNKNDTWFIAKNERGKRWAESGSIAKQGGGKRQTKNEKREREREI